MYWRLEEGDAALRRLEECWLSAGEWQAGVGTSYYCAGAQRIAMRTGTEVKYLLVSHSWANPAPQLAALVTAAFVVFPWDRQVRVDGQWVPHPEVEAGLRAQGEDGS